MKLQKQLWKAAALIFIILPPAGIPISIQAEGLPGNLSADNNPSSLYSDYLLPYINTGSVILSSNSAPYYLAAQNISSIIWTSSNPSIASVSTDGMVIPLYSGTAVMTGIALSKDGSAHYLTCVVLVTNPVLNLSAVELDMASSDTYTLSVAGTPNTTNITWKSSNPAAAVVESGTIHPVSAGRTIVSAVVDGRTLSCEVTVTDNQTVQQRTIILQKGSSATMKTNSNAFNVRWSSMNPKVASITENGTLAANQNGNTRIFADIDGQVITCYVSVPEDIAAVAAKKAKTSLNAPYSQQKRMEDGYYDCSSLIWKAYQPSIAFGSPSWAPTAADLAKWCVSNQKVVAEGPLAITSGKLLPGDLIFYANEKSPNNRYLNIYHVAIFTGYTAEAGSTSNFYGTIIEANGDKVKENKYQWNLSQSKEIVLIARPAK